MANQVLFAKLELITKKLSLPKMNPSQDLFLTMPLKSINT